MAENNQTTAFDQSHKLSATAQKKCENVKCLELKVMQWSKILYHFQNNSFTKIKQPRLNFDQPSIMQTSQNNNNMTSKKSRLSYGTLIVQLPQQRLHKEIRL